MMTKLAVLATVVLLLGSTAGAAYAAQVDERNDSTAAAIEVSNSATFSDNRDELAEISSQATPPLYLPAPAQQSTFADEGVKDSAAFDR